MEFIRKNPPFLFFATFAILPPKLLPGLPSRPAATPAPATPFVPPIAAHFEKVQFTVQTVPVLYSPPPIPAPPLPPLPPRAPVPPLPPVPPVALFSKNVLLVTLNKPAL